MKKSIYLIVGLFVTLNLVFQDRVIASHFDNEYHIKRITETHHIQFGAKPKIKLESLDVVNSVLLEPYAVHQFKVRSNPEVIVRSTNGSITVKRGSSDTVKVEVYITRRGLALLAGDRVGDDFRLVVRQRNNQVYAEVINLKGAAWTSNMPVFDFVIEVPERVNTSLHTNFGDIKISRVSGMVEAKTSSGIIHTSDTQGTFRLSTTSGEVIVESHKGEAFTNLLNGNVNYTNVQGESRVKVMTGNVRMHEMRGSVLVSNTNGNIELTSLMVNQLVDIQTIVGDVSIRLPQKGAFDLQSEAQTITINREYEVSRSYGRETLNAMVNRGGVPIHVKTRVGNVDIQLQ